MATKFGKTFTTRRGRRGRYKYVNGRKVSFEGSKRSYGPKSRYVKSANRRYAKRNRRY